MIPALLAVSAVGGSLSTVAAGFAAGHSVKQVVQNTAWSAATVIYGDESRVLQWERRYGPRPVHRMTAEVSPFPVATEPFLRRYYEGSTVPQYPRVMAGQLAGFVELLSSLHDLGTLGGEVLALLASMEGGRSLRGSLRRFNPGNFKWNRARDSDRPACFYIDGANAPCFAPCFPNWNDGCRYWLDNIFGLSRYNGALDAARRGDIRGFTSIIGRGEYAAAYRNPDAMIPRYIDRVKARALSGEIVRQGKLSGYVLRNGRVERA